MTAPGGRFFAVSLDKRMYDKYNTCMSCFGKDG